MAVFQKPLKKNSLKNYIYIFIYIYSAEASMKTYIILGIAGLILLVLVSKFFEAQFELHKHKLIVKYDEDRAASKEKQLAKQKEKLKLKFSQVYVGNPYLEMILKQYNIIVFGALGAGKTLFANLLCFYLNLKYAYDDHKNRKYNQYMNPDYTAEMQSLQDKNLLRVYANIPLVDADGFKSQELWPFLTQEKRFCEKGIVFTDEFGTSLGKDLWFSEQKNTVEVERIVDMSRFARQNREIKWIGTEQSRDNIFKPIRDRGFTEVQAIRTMTSLTKYAKFKRKLITVFRNILPGYLTINWIKTFQKTLFIEDKIKLAFKLLLPANWLIKREYYMARTVTNNKIKNKYTIFSLVVDFYGNEMLFKFTNKEIFKYNTHQHKDEYMKQFDKEGNRIYA